MAAENVISCQAFHFVEDDFYSIKRYIENVFDDGDLSETESGSKSSTDECCFENAEEEPRETDPLNNESAAPNDTIEELGNDGVVSVDEGREIENLSIHNSQPSDDVQTSLIKNDKVKFSLKVSRPSILKPPQTQGLEDSQLLPTEPVLLRSTSLGGQGTVTKPALPNKASTGCGDIDADKYSNVAPQFREIERERRKGSDHTSKRRQSSSSSSSPSSSTSSTSSYSSNIRKSKRRISRSRSRSRSRKRGSCQSQKKHLDRGRGSCSRGRGMYSYGHQRKKYLENHGSRKDFSNFGRAMPRRLRSPSLERIIAAQFSSSGHNADGRRRQSCSRGTDIDKDTRTLEKGKDIKEKMVPEAESKKISLGLTSNCSGEPTCLNKDTNVMPKFLFTMSSDHEVKESNVGSSGQVGLTTCTQDEVINPFGLWDIDPLLINNIPTDKDLVLTQEKANEYKKQTFVKRSSKTSSIKSHMSEARAARGYGPEPCSLADGQRLSCSVTKLKWAIKSLRTHEDVALCCSLLLRRLQHLSAFEKKSRLRNFVSDLRLWLESRFNRRLSVSESDDSAEGREDKGHSNDPNSDCVSGQQRGTHFLVGKEDGNVNFDWNGVRGLAHAKHRKRVSIISPTSSDSDSEDDSGLHVIEQQIKAILNPAVLGGSITKAEYGEIVSMVVDEVSQCRLKLSRFDCVTFLQRSLKAVVKRKRLC